MSAPGISVRKNAHRVHIHPPAPSVLHSSVCGTFLLLSPVRESDLFCPMVPCCGDMVSIKTSIDPRGRAHGQQPILFPWHASKSEVYPAERRARARGLSMVESEERIRTEDEEVKPESCGLLCVSSSERGLIWARTLRSASAHPHAAKPAVTRHTTSARAFQNKQCMLRKVWFR